MSSGQAPSGVREGKSDTDGDNEESSYDPEFGMSKEDFNRVANVHHRVLEVMHKLQIESEKVRHHLRDDSRALRIWDDYVDDIHCASSRNLTYLLSTYNQKSGLYEQLMRRKSCTNIPVGLSSSVSMSSSVGMSSGVYGKLKQATRNKRVPVAALVGSVAAASATGVATERPSLWKQNLTKET